MSIIPENPIKAALKRGEVVPGIWCHTGSPDLAEAAARLGWPSVYVDLEHGPIGLDQAVHIHRAVLSAGGDVVLRVPSNDPVVLKHALDRGFRTIMVPMVNSAAEAEALANACRYPPAGERGYAAAVVRGSGYGVMEGYLARANDELLLIAQIEHVEAVPKIAEIAAVPGIDALFIGPNDLAGSIGKLERLGEPDVLALCETVERETLASGVYLGSILRPGRTYGDLVKVGAQLIAGPSDVALFVEGARGALAGFVAEGEAAKG